MEALEDSADLAPVPACLSNKGRPIPLVSPFRVGRSSRCDHVIHSAKASREHAMLQYDPANKVWMLIDLGSTNGTYLNGQRLTKPEALGNGDEIRVGDELFVLRLQLTDADECAEVTALDPTQVAIARSPCWILIADVAHSTTLVQQIPPEEWSSRMRQWASECEQIIRPTGGIINEYMGDGLLAFWREQTPGEVPMLEVLRRFHALESASHLRFRVICHFGILGIGGGMSSGVEKLFGRELNFIFKIEKPAGSTEHKLVLTENAVRRLCDAISVEHLGDFEIPGFSGRHSLYSPQF
jgi:adenylate cyclase